MKTWWPTVCLCLWQLLGSPVAHAQADLHNGRLAFYPLDGNANDAGGHARHGVVSGATLARDRGSLKQGLWARFSPSRRGAATGCGGWVSRG